MKIQLIVVQGKPEGKVIPLTGPVFKIGRGEGCHLRPNSELVSREHAEFRVVDEEVTVRDLGSRNGTLVNGPSWVPGKIGPSALGFSAAAASHVVASQPSDAPYLGALTIAAWINVTPGGGDAVVASKVSANGAQNNPFDFIVGSGGLYFVRANGSYCAWLSTATSGSGWHHVAVVAPDANVNTAPIFYLDGVALGTVNLALNSGGPATGDGSPIRLGRRADGAGQLTGSLDDVRLYSRALSPADLAALFAYAGSPSAPQFTTQPGSQ